MAEKLRYNYPAMEAMARQCRDFAVKLDDSAGQGGKFAGQMQQGAMQGPFGDTFVNVLNTYQQKVRRLSEAFQAQANEIEQAMRDMQQADNTAGGKF